MINGHYKFEGMKVEVGTIRIDDSPKKTLMKVNDKVLRTEFVE